MSYIPSERIGSTLASATVGVWLERIANGRTALVCKIPETAIKAVLRGATTSLLIGEVQTSLLRLLCLGLVVQDEVDKPLAIQKPTTDRDDMDLLAQVLASGSTTLHLVNELNHPALSGWCQLEQTAAAKAARGLATCDPWVLTPESSHVVPPSTFASTLTSALDLYQQHIFTSPGDTTSGAVTFSARIPLTLALWRPTATIAVTATHESEPFAIDNGDEGRKLESLCRVVVDALYPLHSYHSPRVQDGATRRELVDLLGFSADSICLIEANARYGLDPSQQLAQQWFDQATAHLLDQRGLFERLRREYFFINASLRTTHVSTSPSRCAGPPTWSYASTSRPRSRRVQLRKSSSRAHGAATC